jgi:hypothetical protein
MRQGRQVLPYITPPASLQRHIARLPVKGEIVDCTYMCVNLRRNAPTSFVGPHVYLYPTSQVILLLSHIRLGDHCCRRWCETLAGIVAP